LATGELPALPDISVPPDPAKVRFWEGTTLPASVPDPATYVHCRPCDCASNGELKPWPNWEELNTRAFVKLRQARAPFPVAIIPGFHGGGIVASYRLKIGLKLLRLGWVGALILSGGHRRGGENEARFLYLEAQRLARRYKVDVTDRLFVEPCSCHSITNLRNSLRLMAAMGLEGGLLVTDAQMTAQAGFFANDLDDEIERELQCPVGRMSLLTGFTPLWRIGDEGNGCRAQLSWTNNPLTFLLPNKRLSIFWVSPYLTVAGERRSALDCKAGNERLFGCEPDNQDAATDGCLPLVGRTDQLCQTSSEQR